MKNRKIIIKIDFLPEHLEGYDDVSPELLFEDYFKNEHGVAYQILSDNVIDDK